MENIDTSITIQLVGWGVGFTAGNSSLTSEEGSRKTPKSHDHRCNRKPFQGVSVWLFGDSGRGAQHHLHILHRELGVFPWRQHEGKRTGGGGV